MFFTKKKCFSKCWKICRKWHVSESTFNKKTPLHVFSREFLETIEGTVFKKYVRVTTCECWRLDVQPWIFSPLRFLILINSILMDLLMGWRNSMFKLFTVEQRNSLEFSGIFGLLSTICFSCLIIIWKNVDLLLIFVICMILFYVLFITILILVEVMVEVISFDVCMNFLIIFLLHLNSSWRTLLLRNLFFYFLLFVQFVLVKCIS